MENKTPTAEECLIKEKVLLKTIKESGNFPLNLTRDTHIGSAHAIKRAMIEFAKLHVTAALNEVTEKLYFRDSDGHVIRSEESNQLVLKVYPLTNIK
jgi:hypothetical protein